MNPSSPEVATRQAGHPRAWLGFLLLGGVLTAAASIATDRSSRVEALCWGLGQGASALAVFAGVRRHGLGRSRPWRLMRAAVVVLWAATTLGWGIGGVWLGNSELLELYRIGTLAAHGLSLTALISLNLQTNGSRWAALLDGGIISVGVAMPLWTFLIAPALAQSGRLSTALVLALIPPVIDLFAFGVITRMTLDSDRAPWLRLLSVSYLALFAADGAYLLDQVAGRPAGSLTTVGWMSWSVLIGAAALHPSMAGADRVRPAAASGRNRVLIFLALALLSPAASILGGWLQNDRSSHGDLVVTALTLLLAVLLVLRLSVVAGIAETQATDLRDVLHQKDVLQRSLAHRATHDPLTGLGNRALLGEALQGAIADHAARPGGSAPALLLLDLDGFKDVNDTYGHPVGDELLTVVARRLRGLTADGQVLARLGGDEFAIVLPGAGLGAATAEAERVLETVRAPYLIDGRELYATTSVGVLAESSLTTASDALRDADLALYAAKAAGKNQIAVFDYTLRAERLHHAEIAAGLRQALARDEFRLAYQPVVDLTSGGIYAVEALLRWTPTGGRPVPPDVFVPVAEDTGLIVDIGRWVLERACADAKRWHERHGIAVTVNVSGRQLRERTFRETAMEILARHALPRNALTIEVTESMLLATSPAETQRIVDVLADLRAHGVRIALDDFGTGYSSLAYLRTLPVDILKIDRSFTAPLTGADHRQARAFTKAIVELAASLDLSTVVEGVESREQAAVLQQMGCPLAQGYLFSPPVSPEEVDDLLRVTPWRHAA
jgi:diguanylate cyclase (GGDEF)-like protein